MFEKLKAFLVERSTARRFRPRDTFMSVYAVGNKYLGIRTVTPWGRSRDILITYEESTALIQAFLDARQDLIVQAIRDTKALEGAAVLPPGIPEVGH